MARKPKPNQGVRPTAATIAKLDELWRWYRGFVQSNYNVPPPRAREFSPFANRNESPHVWVVEITSSSSSGGLRAGKLLYLAGHDGTPDWADFDDGDDAWIIEQGNTTFTQGDVIGAVVVGINENDGVPILFPFAGDPDAPEAGSDCTGRLGWLRDIDSITAPKGGKRASLKMTVMEALGRCDCVSTGDVIHFLWDEATDQFEGIGSLVTCCGCGRFTLSFNDIASLLLGIPVLTLHGNDGCSSDSSYTLVWDAECGDDGVIYLAGFNNEMCEADVRADSECPNLVRVKIECITCELEDVGCDSCEEKIGPAVWKVTAGTDVYYLASTGACTCAWSLDCGDYDLTLSVTSGAITVIFSSPDGNATYQVTSGSGGGDLSCWNEHTLPRTAGSSPLPDQVTIEPVSCDFSSIQGCNVGADSGFPLYVWATTPDINNPQSLTRASGSPQPCEFYGGTTTTCGPGTTNGHQWGIWRNDNGTWTWGVYNGEDSDIPNSPDVGWSQTGPLRIHSFDPFIASFCYTPATGHCGEGVEQTVKIGESGTEAPEITVGQECFSQYWCVDNIGSFSCVESDTEPFGAVAGPFADAATCALACGCQSSGASALAGPGWMEIVGE